MAWVIILVLWMAISVVVAAPYVKQIENMEDKSKKVISCIVFAVGGPVIILSGFVIETLEDMGIVFEDEDLWE